MDEGLMRCLKNWKNIHVRNMYWLLFSPSPIAEHSLPDIPIFPEGWLQRLEVESRSFFEDLDVNPTELEAVVNKMKTSRLGVYAEVLLGYFFEYSPSTKLVLHNFQLIQDRTTLGEIDFVIEWEGRLIHIELATKFYLAHQPSNDYASWIGPSGNDDLQTKLEKVSSHQLPIGRSTEFKEQTQLVVESYFLLKGQFYSQNNYFPAWKNPRANFHQFYYYSDFMDRMYHRRSVFVVLLRPHWLSATLYPFKEFSEKLPDNLKAMHDYFHHYGALHIYDNEKNEPFFIVADKWPNS